MVSTQLAIQKANFYACAEKSRKVGHKKYSIEKPILLNFVNLSAIPYLNRAPTKGRFMIWLIKYSVCSN